MVVLSTVDKRLPAVTIDYIYSVSMVIAMADKAAHNHFQEDGFGKKLLL